MTTCQPRSASTMAATAPPAPLPTTTALSATPAPSGQANPAGGALEVLAEERLDLRLDRVGPVGLADLGAREAPGLRVPRELDVLPSHQGLVPAVLGDRVHPLDGVLEQQAPERRLREGAVLLLRRRGREVPAGQPVELLHAPPVRALVGVDALLPSELAHPG